MKLGHVECHSGYKANERPLSFTLGNRKFAVKELLDQWYGIDYTYFKVRADDDNIYILKYEEHKDEWSLEFFKAKEKT
jgi:hypothetical protein